MRARGVFRAAIDGLLLLGLSHFTAELAVATQINDAQVSDSQGIYYVGFDVWIERELPRVQGLVTDYRRWPELSDIVTEVAPLSAAENGDERLRMTLRVCMLFYCRNVTKVQEIHFVSANYMVSTLIPDNSNDFILAEEHWRFASEKQGTRVQYQAHFQPDFFVPPLIGPLLIKSKIRKELRLTITRLEALTRN